VSSLGEVAPSRAQSFLPRLPVALATGSRDVNCVRGGTSGPDFEVQGAHSVYGTAARFFLSLGNVFFSLILGALALGFFWFTFPDWTLQLFKWAGSLRESLISGTTPARYEVVLRALVDERQIVYMGFVLATRIVVGLLIVLVYKLIGRRPQEEFPI
jgi:hypothetical protein